jgi:hypothetical protein
METLLLNSPFTYPLSPSSFVHPPSSILMPQVYDGDPPRERVIVQKREVVKSGVGLGSALAVAISWSLHKSILWAIVHGILSWLYVIYYAVTR